jgi:hypothetical protein
MPPVASTRPVISSGRSPAPSTSDISTNPAAPASSPAAMMCGVRNRVVRRGATREPIAMTMLVGSIHSPACRVERPSTTCRYIVVHQRDAGHHDAAEEHDAERGAEDGLGEQREVEQRVGQPAAAGGRS